MIACQFLHEPERHAAPSLALRRRLEVDRPTAPRQKNGRHTSRFIPQTKRKDMNTNILIVP